MGQWKLATVLLAAAFAMAIACVLAAAQVWDYAYPRAIFLNSMYFFAGSALLFLIVVLFLDDVADWIRNRTSGFLRVLLSLSFSVVFTILMVCALYSGAIGGRSLADLSVCSFDSVDAICLKKQADLSEAELQAVKKTLSYHLTFGSHPAVVNILKYSQNHYEKAE